MTEPAYSLLNDHTKLKEVNLDVDTSNLCEQVNSSLRHPLNHSQADVFKHSFNNRVTLLWGPPGTGKTTTLAGIVLGWIEYANNNNINLNIGIGSSTWTAIDNLLYEIEDVLDLHKLKYGDYNKQIEIHRVRSSISDPFSHAAIRDTIIYSNEASELKKKLDANDRIIICGSTWKQFYNLSKASQRDDASGKEWFDLLLIDEASQVKVEHAAGYFLFMKKNAHLILAGDDKQLGPIHGFKMEDHSNGLYDCIYTFMKETHKVPTIPIVDNYRSNLYINDWPNKRFYHGKLISKSPNNALEIELPISKPHNWPEDLIWNDQYLDILNPEKPVVVITYPKSVHTVSNTFESQITAGIASLYRLLLEESVEEEEFTNKRIGIVTPHRAQRSQIQNLLLGVDVDISSDAFIDTVDRFQGQERDLIIASYSVSDPDFVASEDAFILDSRRFNVSLTRAKSKFIILVSEAIIDHLSNDKEVAEDASHLQMFVLKYCNQEEAVNLNYIENGEPETMPCNLRFPSS